MPETRDPVRTATGRAALASAAGHAAVAAVGAVAAADSTSDRPLFVLLTALGAAGAVAALLVRLGARSASAGGRGALGSAAVLLIGSVALVVAITLREQGLAVAVIGVLLVATNGVLLLRAARGPAPGTGGDLSRRPA
ncbi:hypothetical protein [Nocardioides sp. SYSU DS0663]|uniref:hypothetical protein n=1 Tax=Nocardioides sp. SYSU DS0663 TaxID=3416445 RepID=UPI003F4C6227